MTSVFLSNLLIFRVLAHLFVGDLFFYTVKISLLYINSGGFVQIIQHADSLQNVFMLL